MDCIDSSLIKEVHIVTPDLKFAKDHDVALGLKKEWFINGRPYSQLILGLYIELVRSGHTLEIKLDAEWIKYLSNPDQLSMIDMSNRPVIKEISLPILEKLVEGCLASYKDHSGYIEFKGRNNFMLGRGINI